MKRLSYFGSQCLLFMAAVGAGAAISLGEQPVVWSWEWKASAEETSAPTVEVCPLKYDKEWAYAVEIDDGPASTLTVCQPLLARFEFTDAPPGMAGGKALPFVGGAAVMVLRVGTANNTFLSWEQLRELERKGWAVLNHSYWHSGNHWDPTQRLKPEEFRRELYWSQALLAAMLWNGRSDTTFVYPNGDYNYESYLKEFGIRSATRVGGKCKTLTADAAAFLDLDRNWLDEAVWVKEGDPMTGFPKAGPRRGDLVIDFTHHIAPEADSENQRRWVKRLTQIAVKYGKAGVDSMWCAPTSEVISYTLAARAAKVVAERGRLTVTLPDTVPGSALTWKLTGVSAQSQLLAPPGGTVYRKGNQAWLTTPVLGLRGSVAPKPALKLVYQGPVKNVTLEKPQAIAAVRLLQAGKVSPLQIELVSSEGKVEPLVSGEQGKVKEQWGIWLLFPTVPDRATILAREIRIAPDRSLQAMEIWASAEGSSAK